MKFRLILKTGITSLVVFLCIGLAVSLYLKISQAEKAEDFNLYTLVPQDAMAIIDTDNLVDLLGDINELNSTKDNHSLQASLLFTQLKEHINTLLDETPHGFSRQMNKMLISFHKPDNERNQVLYCRLGSGDKELIEKFIKKYGSSTFPAKYVDYKGEEIRIYPMLDDTFIACYITSHFFVASYQKKLVEDVIDAKLTKENVLAYPDFPLKNSTGRMQMPAAVYIRMQPLNMGKDTTENPARALLGGWAEFNVKMNTDAIYFTGVNHQTDSIPTFMSMLQKQQLIGEFPGTLLPASTFYFNRISVSDVQALFKFTSDYEFVDASPRQQYIMSRDEELVDFFTEYAGRYVTTCMFHAHDSILARPCAVVNMPIKNGVQAERFLRNLLRTTPAEEGREKVVERIAHHTSSGTHYLHTLMPNTIASQLTGVVDSSLLSYACFYKGQFLIAPDSRSIIAYIDAMEKKELLEKNAVYEEAMASLSSLYCFLMMADLGTIIEQPDNYGRLIPGFFFRNGNFFENFILTAQFTNVDDVIYPNVLLLYKGVDIIEPDSLSLEVNEAAEEGIEL